MWHVRRSLRWINQADLVGLDFIRLADEMPPPSNDSPDWHRTASAEGHSINGVYFARDDNTPACITLLIRDICVGIPDRYWLTPVPTLRIAHTLAHEVAHHLVKVRGHVFQPGENFKSVEYEEEFADRYAHGVVKKMETRWYYRLGQSLVKNLAMSHYIQGMLDWKAQKYERAAERWYKAWNLNPNLNEASYWHRRAKEMVKSEQQQ